MKLTLVNENGRAIENPYTIKLYGWSEEKYYRDAPDDLKCEFVQGETIMYCPMSIEHSKVTGFLYFLLKGYCDAKKLGEVLSDPTVRLYPETNRQPDICFVPPESSAQATGMPMKAIPSFIVEVSWSTQEIDLQEKARDYQRAGIREYWVVDIENREVTVHLLENNQYQKTRRTEGHLESRVILGFSIEITWLWQSPLPSAFDCLHKILRMSR